MTGHLLYTEEDVELVHLTINDVSLPDTGDDLARAVLARLASAGRLLDPRSETQEEYGVRWPDGDVTYKTRQQAFNFATAYPGQPDAFVISRRVITTPWSPSVPDTEEGT